MRQVSWRMIGAPYWPMADRDLAARIGGKPAGLLVLLTLSPERKSRDDIARLLWPDLETSRAKHNLRQALHTIRQALGDKDAFRLVASGDDLRFDASGVSLDLHRFAEIEAGADPAPGELEILCTGRLLDGLQTRSEPFDALLDTWREDLNRRRIALLDRTLSSLRDTSGEAARSLHALRARVADETERAAGPKAAPTRPVASTGRDRPRRMRWISGVLVGLLMGMTLIVGAFALSQSFRGFLRETIAGTHGTAHKIAVRPFEVANGSAAEQNLAGGVTIGVTYALYAITDRDLFVVTVPPGDPGIETADARSFARDLGVRYLITGSLEQDGDLVRVFVRCYDAETDTDIWQDRFDSKVVEAFSLQDEITLRILRGLEIDLSSAERNRIQYLDDTDNLNAWLLAANGVRNLIKLEPQNLEEALASYRKALEIDPEYTSARRGLAWYELLNVRFGTAPDPENSLLVARNHLDVILRRRPDDGMSLALAGLMLLLENDWEASIASGVEATRLLPGSADVWAVLAHSYTFAGKPESALEAIERAMALSPGHPEFYNWIKARALRLSGRYDKSIELLLENLAPSERALVQLVELTAAYSAAGKIAEARTIAGRIKVVKPDFSASHWVLHPAMQDPEAQSVEFELLSKAGL